jgi:CRISPR/Cas system-associated endoribonuclease Cas2
MEHDFLLLIKAARESTDIDGEVTRLIEKEDLGHCLKRRYVNWWQAEAIYHLRLSRGMLIRLKGSIDEFIEYEEFDLFEWRDW